VQLSSPNRNFICLVSFSASAVIIAAGLLVIFTATPVLANNGDMDTLRAKYSHIAGTRLDDCDVCHTSTHPSRLNDYGEAYSADRTQAGLTAIEATDSDGDGFTNLEEITALTFPGDAADHPAPENPDMLLARQKYPAITATRLDSCKLCHTNEPALNQYGADFNANGRNLDAFALIEPLDSDEDGYTNLEEITALTYPGGCNDYPVDDTDDMAWAIEAYPALAETRLDACTLCHTSGSDLNNYGADYLANGRNPDAFGLIEALDSDTDGFINLDEINLLTFPGDSTDYPDDMALALAAYPHLAQTDLDNCNLCHHADYSLNDYGTDYQNYGRNPAAFGLIEQLDSDGDGHLNIDELTLIYFPGNPNDYPAHMELLLLHYPDLDNTPLESCDLCHTDDWGLNPYGTDYNDYGNNRAAFGLIEQLDSDDDGYLNFEEIDALTMPGDPADSPAQSEPNYRVFLPIVIR